MLKLFAELADSGLGFIDIGCRGDIDQLDPRWLSLVPLFDYIGFDPDRSELDRLEKEEHPFRSRRLLGCAVGSRNAPSKLYLTDSPFCHSLLRPRNAWLDRLTCGDSFEPRGEEEVETRTLDRLVETEGIAGDILKIDSQGMELPILEHAQRLLPSLLCIEAETGFVENYVGETVLSQLDPFLKERGFLMFDLRVHRSARRNALAGVGVEQPFYCESVWVRDFLAASSWGIEVQTPDRITAVKTLTICWALRFADYGLELAEHFAGLGLITREELLRLGARSLWEEPLPGGATGFLARLLSLFPSRLRRRWLEAATIASKRPHLLNTLRG